MAGKPGILGAARCSGLPAGQLPVPRAMCRIAIVSLVISYKIRYRPTRSRSRSGDPYGNAPAGRGSSASWSIASSTAPMPGGSSRNAAA